MMSRLSAVLLSGAIGILATGCASSSPTFRAQSPPATFASWGGGQAHGDGCPMCQMSGPGQACHGAGHCNDPHGCNLPCHPVHRNFHTYSYPQDLMYPPENTAAAITQYPYYTLRGPTDFFMK